MRLSQFLDQIRRNRDAELVHKLQSVQPFLQAEVSRIEHDEEVIRNRDKYIGDQERILQEGGYQQGDIQDLLQRAKSLSSASSVNEAVSQFKHKKDIESRLKSQGIEIPKDSSLSDLQQMLEESTASRNKSSAIVSKVKTMGLYDEFSRIISEDDEKDFELAYGKLMKGLSSEETEIKAKGLGSKYYALYKRAIGSGTDPVIAFADASDQKAKEDYLTKKETEQAVKPKNAKPSKHEKNIVNDGNNMFLYFKKGDVVYRVRAGYNDKGELVGINKANNSLLALNPNINFLTPNQILNIDPYDIEDAPGVTITKDGTVRNGEWVDSSRLKKGVKQDPAPKDKVNSLINKYTGA